MSESKFNPSTIVLLLVVAFASAIRVAAPLSDNFKDIANFSSLGAIAMFGAAYFKQPLKAFGFPLLVLVLSGLFIAKISGYGFFFAGWYWQYIAFILMTLASRSLLKKITVQSLVLTTVVTTLIHWVVSDISAMYIPGLYPPTLAGFWTCLVAAIPFELKFLYGTILYGTIMFGFMAWYPSLSFKKRLNA